ncbi:MAG: DNA polymerase/3'-5' exonuclease PolX [Armatimonadota bacterium]|nr:DNA polymerase/3'-5' exonuclease PolX [Armatimonadota bacterium]MDR7452286.1 DNA polymerase/3'-5' exonuclease PolX [Armatimonadota bacterium]MDR7467950.1 DNA polymerase/3'-5' exonuclease PolX [Armatimonadota bacterium]MDR7494792.1 DNA polymerase/3'-5' exonuclease PolX [Armatimonadota bacterium]MDR7499253.1 DNA polymerase/3'-5' exonuclease PolX [Armatimonadota bacterium]
MQNRAIAAMFNDIADMLEIKQDSPFRITAYRRAARALETLSEDVAAVAARGALTSIPGIGKGTAEKIEEFLRTGRCRYYDELRASLPEGITALMAVPEVGPKTALLLHQRLGITTIEQLEQACREGRVRTLPRLGAKTEENILKGIALLRRTKERQPLGRVLPQAREIVDALRGLKEVTSLAVAGSLRRMKESVGDIDIVVTSTTPGPVMETFTSLPRVKQVLAKGPTRSSVVLDSGIQADVRVVEPESFGAALQYFTGSKDHNVKIRERAVRRGLKINEYGVFRVKDNRRLAGRTEEEVYAAVGLPWIPPEIREDQGEIELAEQGRLPVLVQRSDIRGDLQMHTRWSDGTDNVEAMARAAKDLGYEYIAITDHSQSLKFVGGVPVDELRANARTCRQVSDKVGLAVLIGTECDILPDGRLDYPDEVLAELDVVVASVHSRLRMGREEMTARIVKAMENPHVDIIGHPTGRLLGQREAYAVDMERLVEAARRTGTALEINASPERLDLSDVHARLARERGVMLVISTDAHSRYELRHMEYGLGVARRAWVEPRHVLNTRPLAELRAYLASR